jgi:hypothetical protein
MIGRKPCSFEEYLRASKEWEREGLTLGTARALANAGFLTIEDVQAVPIWELAALPRVGGKSLTVLSKLVAQQTAAGMRSSVRREDLRR